MNETQEEGFDKMSNLRNSFVIWTRSSSEAAAANSVRPEKAWLRRSKRTGTADISWAARCGHTRRISRRNRNGWARRKVIAAAIDHLERTVSGSGPRFLG